MRFENIGDKRAVILRRGQIALFHDERGWRLPQCPGVIETEDEIFHPAEGTLAISTQCDAPEGTEYVGLRESWKLLGREEYLLAAKGAELLNWAAVTRFCSGCGSRLRRNTEISLVCPSCGREYFPQLSPAVVVLVTKGEEALLVHAANFKRPFHALVAGFVETGETLEECVAREVREETTLEIEDIRYFGSQSWPFPHQLMLGFTARWKEGEVRFADGELTSGGFFSRDALPELPTPPSLSRAIIDAWIEGKL